MSEMLDLYATVFFLLSQNYNNEKNYAQLDDSRIIQIYMTSLK